jgi:hypothetical protein
MARISRGAQQRDGPHQPRSPAAGWHMRTIEIPSLCVLLSNAPETRGCGTLHKRGCRLPQPPEKRFGPAPRRRVTSGASFSPVSGITHRVPQGPSVRAPGPLRPGLRPAALAGTGVTGTWTTGTRRIVRRRRRLAWRLRSRAMGGGPGGRPTGWCGPARAVRRHH